MSLWPIFPRGCESMKFMKKRVSNEVWLAYSVIRVGPLSCQWASHEYTSPLFVGQSTLSMLSHSNFTFTWTFVSLYIFISRSCPPIKIYDEEHVQEQLTAAAQAFLNGPALSVDVSKVQCLWIFPLSVSVTHYLERDINVKNSWLVQKWFWTNR